MMVGEPASIAATAEFVVPRSMPTTFSPGATSAYTVVRHRVLLRDSAPTAHAARRPAAIVVELPEMEL